MEGQANWFSLIIATVTAGSVLVGKILSSRAKRRSAKTEEGLAALEWAKEFEGRTQRAEAKAQAAEDKNAETERRQITMERRLVKGEEAADNLVELIEWIGQVIDLAHDTNDGDHARLVAFINGGPGVYRRHKP
jgi:hypothetical protein